MPHAERGHPPRENKEKTGSKENSMKRTAPAKKKKGQPHAVLPREKVAARADYRWQDW